jgi:hypothetical protein
VQLFIIFIQEIPLNNVREKEVFMKNTGYVQNLALKTAFKFNFAILNILNTVFNQELPTLIQD